MLFAGTFLQTIRMTPERRERMRRVARYTWPTLRYWMETEVHVYAFSIAASMILSFFPFMIVMVSICRYFLHWDAAVDATYFALGDYFPGELGAFISRNLDVRVHTNGPLQIFSVLLLFFTANGIFEPLEVALNRVFGAKTNRTYVRNQLVSLALIFACGGLVMASLVFTAMNDQIVARFFGEGIVFRVAARIAFKIAAIPITILILFLVYWVLPNVKVRPRRILPAAIIVGLSLEVLKYINLLLWPWFSAKMEREYGPFQYSVTLILWGFLASMIILGGAEWAARRRLQDSPPVP